MDITIIICTRNNVESLRQTLAALSGVRVPERLRCELLVVDNGSTDETRDVLKSYALPRVEVGYLYEPRRGLSFARNAALASARGSVMLWTDDDVRPSRNWVEGMCAPLLSGEAHAVAGGVRLAPSLERPWMSCLHRAWLAATEYLEAHGPRRMVGANMAFSRDVLRQVPSFDTELGAGALGFHEETLFSFQLKRAGFSLMSAFDVVVEHHFDKSRLLRESFLGCAERLGRSDAYWAYHWEHEDVEEPDLRLESSRHRLSDWRRRHKKKYAGREGVAEREMALTHEVYFYEQYLVEKGRPRNYDRYGLVKRPLAE